MSSIVQFSEDSLKIPYAIYLTLTSPSQLEAQTRLWDVVKMGIQDVDSVLILDLQICQVPKLFGQYLRLSL